MSILIPDPNNILNYLWIGLRIFSEDRVNDLLDIRLDTSSDVFISNLSDFFIEDCRSP